MNVVNLIVSAAKIPSFSSFEERIHGFIRSVLGKYKHVEIVEINANNLLVFVNGLNDFKPVAITSHLDKINHFGEVFPDELHVELQGERIVGQMDDTAGIGLCLDLVQKAAHGKFPPLYILFSEMEESMGLKQHPHLLKNHGKDVGPQIGARRLSEYLLANNLCPATFITLDTTPVFKGDPGVALYTEAWSKGQFEPSEALLTKLEALKAFICKADPDIRLANGTNDYQVYGEYFSNPKQGDVPSIAIEPAIYPYHQIGEGVFVKDIKRIATLLDSLLLNFDFTFAN